MKRKLIYIVIIFYAASLMLSSTAAARNGSADVDHSGKAEPSVVNWCLIGDPPEDMAAVTKKANEYIRNKLNAEIHFDFMGWDNYAHKKRMYYSAGEPMDIVFTASWLNYDLEASNGYYFPLDGLIDEFAPETRAILGESVLKAAEVEDRIYALPVPGQCNASASGIKFRKDMVKKYNIDLSKIKKLEDVEPVLKLIKSKQPSIIPLFNGSQTLNFDILNMENFEGGLKSPGSLNITGKDYKVYNEFTKPELKTFFKTLNKFHKLGYLKTPKDKNNIAELNKAFAILNTDLTPVYDEYDRNVEWVNIYLARPSINHSSATACMDAISSKTEDPEMDMKLLELINTDTYLNNLLHFGIEGKHYVKVSQNVITHPKDKDFSTPQYLYWMLGNRYLDFTFSYEDKNIHQALKDFNNAAIDNKAIGFKFESVYVSKESVACYDIWNQYIPKFINGEYDPDKYIPIMNNAFKSAGADKIIAEKQKQLDVWLDSQYLVR